MKTHTWSSPPCNLQNLPRRTPEGGAIRKAFQEHLVADMTSEGFNPWALSVFPAHIRTYPLVRAAVREALCART